MLREAFHDALDIVLLHDSPRGINSREHLVETIADVDILIPIFTDPTSATFTGFEIGTFVASLQSKPTTRVDRPSERRLIPIVLFSEVPELLRPYPALILELNQDGDNDALARSTEKIAAFLENIRALVSPYLNEEDRVVSDSNIERDHYKILASTLYTELRVDIGERIKSMTTPATLIIRLPPATRRTDNHIRSGTVRAFGYCYEAFHIDQDDRFVDWNTFLQYALDKETAMAWEEAFQSLITSDLLRSQTIPSFDGAKVFRLFVSRKVTLFSGIDEYYIYVAPERQIIPTRQGQIGEENAPSQTTSLSLGNPSRSSEGVRSNRSPGAARKAGKRHGARDRPRQARAAHIESDIAPNRNSTVNVFISYRHVDHKIVDEVRDHLGWVEQNLRINVFDDRSIIAGEDWNERILKELNRADIIILLVSAAFMRSTYCTKIELREALNTRAGRGTVIIPVIVEACDWEAMPIRGIAALPKDDSNNLKPLNKWYRNTDVALTQVAKNVRKYVEAWL
jgi:hypothetical protein